MGKFVISLMVLIAKLLITIVSTFAVASPNRDDILSLVPASSAVGQQLEAPKVWPVLNDDKSLGWVFETDVIVDIPAYSGKPVNVLVGIDTQGNITGTKILEHHEPILLVGIPEQKLFDFAAKYIGFNAADHVTIGGTSTEDSHSLDAITGATVTVMVVNETIMRAARKVAIALDVIEVDEAKPPMATVYMDVFESKTWGELTGEGAIRKMALTRADIDQSFVGTDAEHVDTATPEEADDVFIDMYYAYLNAPAIGKNLLGDSEYTWLMGELQEGEHAIAVMANGIYSFKGSGYVRGGIFDRIQMVHDGVEISFRDLDYYRLMDLYAEGTPHLSELAVFIVRDRHEFNPGALWQLDLLVRRQIGPIESLFSRFNADYYLPDKYVHRPEPVVNKVENEPIWVAIWRDRLFQVVVLITSLVFLSAIIFFQDWLVRYPALLHNIRRAFLVYTVTFIGLYGLGQLSVVNVFTFTHSLMHGFSWDLFLLDPMIFILWGFTAATVLLWGRGIFCGWLCPFGALQELINQLARKLKIRQLELPFSVHERLWAVKYIIFLALFAVSLESMSNAEKLAEIEPFKTSITLAFQREWWFVTYAVVLLIASIFTRKIYCRYICPLGAALAIPTKLRLFDWLKRRNECGNPCQLCKVECEIQAIHPEGHINANECHHCLDCQMTYYDEHKCPPLIVKQRRRNKSKVSGQARDKDLMIEVINQVD